MAEHDIMSCARSTHMYSPFTQNMVRIMIGTLIDIAKNENNFSVKDILEKNDRSFAGKTAPAKGLFFLGPKYNEIKTQTMENNLIDRFKI